MDQVLYVTNITISKITEQHCPHIESKYPDTARVKITNIDSAVVQINRHPSG